MSLCNAYNKTGDTPRYKRNVPTRGKGYSMFQRNNRGNISSKVSAIIIMVIGIGMMIVGIWMAAVRIHKDNYYGLATGKVTGSSYYENSDDERMYSAIYAYSVDDTEYELEDDDTSKVPPQVGKKVEIRYNPDQPEDAYVDGKPLPGSILMSIGIIMIMLSILAFVKMRKGQMSGERKLVIELLTGIIMLVVCIGSITLIHDSGEGIGLSEISIIVCGIVGIIVIISSVKYYIDVKMGRTPSESLLTHLGLDAASLILDDESEGEEYNIPKYLMPESEQAKEVGEKSQKQEYEKLDHLQGDGTQNPYSGNVPTNAPTNAQMEEQNGIQKI